MRPLHVALCLLALALPAHAWHDQDPVTDYSAATLHDDEFRIGLFKVGYGFTEWLQVETYTAPWLVGALTLNAKAAMTDGDFEYALELGLLRWNPASLVQGDDEGTVDTPVTAIPLTAWATWQPEGDFRLSVFAGYTATTLEAEVDEADASGAGAVSTGRLGASFEYRFGRVFAAVLEGHLMLYESIRADAETTTEVDEDTTVTVYGDSDVEFGSNLRGHVTVSAMWSWEQFNLRLGVGYGHYRVPQISYFVPVVTPVPELALFWRF